MKNKLYTSINEFKKSLNKSNKVNENASLTDKYFTKIFDIVKNTDLEIIADYFSNGFNLNEQDIDANIWDANTRSMVHFIINVLENEKDILEFIDFLTNDDINESKKTFKVNPQIGKSKYSISFHDGKKTHKDGSKFNDIKTFKTKTELDKAIKDFEDKGYIKESRK